MNSALMNRYVEILQKWNRAINLVQEKTMLDVYSRHINDSLQICRYMKKSDFVIDVGSGAGFPGIVLAIEGFSNVVLCEKNRKKASFLKEVRRELCLSCHIFDGDVNDFMEKDYVMVSRAFSSLENLLYIMEKISAKRGVFHKGENYKAEVSDARKVFDFDINITKSETNKNGVILDVCNLRRS